MQNIGKIYYIIAFTSLFDSLMPHVWSLAKPIFRLISDPTRPILSPALMSVLYPIIIRGRKKLSVALIGFKQWWQGVTRFRGLASIRKQSLVSLKCFVTYYDTLLLSQALFCVTCAILIVISTVAGAIFSRSFFY